jgi:VCBS repeat-containing protein
VTETETVNITVTSVNDVPVANDDSFTTDEDTSVNIPVLGNDSDPEGDPLTVSEIDGQPAVVGTPVTLTDGSGTVTLNGDGTLTFEPTPDYNGPVSFTYEVEDGNGGSDTATVTGTVNPVNDPPVAVADGFTAAADAPAAVVGNALGNDSDPDGDALAVTPQSGVAGSAGGVFSIDAAGAVSFDPNGAFDDLAPGATRDTTLVYQISDGQGGFDTATITVTVNGANDAPVGADDSITVSEDVPFVGTLPVGTDVDGDALNYALTSAPANGTVVINGDGSYTYTPTADYNGTDSFTYTVNEGNGGSNTYTVSVGVTPVQDTVADSLTTPEDTAITFNVLTGAGGASADNFEGTPQVTATSSPANGVIVVSPDGTITYTPNANYSGPDSFTYTVTSPAGVTETETVNITVTSVNDVPVANDDSFTTDEDTSVNIPVLGNDSDPDGDPLTVSEIDGRPAVVGAPVTLTDGSGTVTLNLDGTLTFEPTPDFNGPVSFTYEIEDGNGGTDTATVTGTVNPVNDPPVAVDDGPFTTSENEPLTGNVLGNDSDPDGDALTVTSFTIAGDPTVYPAGTTASMPGVGTLVIQSDGGFTFVPATDYVGPVPSATYTVSDGGATDTAVLSFDDVQPGPVPPTVVPPQPGPNPSAGPGLGSPIIDVLPEVNPPQVPGNPPAVNPAGGGASSVTIAPTPGSNAGLVPGNHLHVLVAVGESSQSQLLAGAGLAGIQANAPLLGEAQSQTPDNLLFVQAGGNHLAGMGEEPGLGDVRQVPHSLHVQHAVRHQPIVSDIGLYVQQAVRASQLESAVRNAVLDAQHTATPGFDTLMDPFALGAPHPEASAEPAKEPAAAPAPKASESPPQEVKPGGDEALAEAGTQPEITVPVEPSRLQARAAVGFRAQLQGMGKDRSVNARPLTRDVAHV